MEHRTGLPLDVEATEASGFAERKAVRTIRDRLPPCAHRTLAADKAFNTTDFVANSRARLDIRAAEDLAAALFCDTARSGRRC